MGQLLLRSARVLAFVLVAACATTSGRTRDLEARLAKAETEVERGQIRYEASCQRCHALFMPRSYRAYEWRFFVDKYGRRARLSAEERESVYNYLAMEAARR